MDCNIENCAPHARKTQEPTKGVDLDWVGLEISLPGALYRELRSHANSGDILGRISKNPS